jgi:multiple sugar transport system permease protein
MSLIAKVGRKAWTVRAMFAGIYLVLTAGAVTMVYPFLVTFSGSFKTSVDRADFDLIPAWFRDDTVLYRKHLECKFNNSISAFSVATRTRAYSFAAAQPPPPCPAARVEDWRAFEATNITPVAEWTLGYTVHSGDRLELWKHREFRRSLMRDYKDDLDAFNRAMGAYAPGWLAVAPPVERPMDRRYRAGGEPLLDAFLVFKSDQPAWLRVYSSLDGRFVRQFLESQYGSVESYNKRHGTAYRSYDDIVLSETAPTNATERADWERFVRDELNTQFIANSPDAAAVRSAPLDALRIDSPEIRYRRFLRERYGGNLTALNRAHGAAYLSFAAVPMPTIEADYAAFREHHAELRHEFLTANYMQVFDYIALHGRALLNTAIYCLLAVLVALTINPMAAYALSRYRMRATYRILLFFMATMAFPAAVTMIPGFLLLKGMGLLNTFAALVLPGAANGFSIFLLKGFFDALPRSLYESAELDGAGEWTLFWNVTMALSKPILAVVGLNAFTAAYGNFMFAFLLCPDEKLWTLMVFLYQLQINGHTALTFAALLVAAIPTLIAFLACQRVIMRGIVVPVEK